MADEEKVVFVTVGTTSFDRLIETASSPVICQVLQRLGYTTLLLQIGRGEVEPNTYSTCQFTVEFYRYKDSIAEDIKNASLVISHAGTMCSSLQEVLEDQDLSNLVPLPPGNPKVFGSYMNSVMGLTDR
ncbi:hypothetical protein QZH41_013151 [Actinostola sp. cb2023]|nr:hypothetical protein QZH41_013151 [Actinostola sp. cb2023]